MTLDEGEGDWPKNLRNVSEHVSERSEQSNVENSPGEARDKPGDPEDDADILAASDCIDDARCVPKKLKNASECQHKRPGHGEEEISPKRPPDDPDDPGQRNGCTR